MAKNPPNKAIIYALTNPCMPNLVKIGFTKTPVQQRMKRLDNTSVPAPFKFLHAVAVHDAEKIEHLLHRGLKGLLDQEYHRKEFYRITPESARSLLEIIERLGGEKVDQDYDPRHLPTSHKDTSPKEQNRDTNTSAASRFSDSTDSVLVPRIKNRFNGFIELGIKNGDVLKLKGHPDVTCTVVNDMQVSYQDKFMSLSKAAQTALRRRVQPSGTLCWLFKGKLIRDLIDEFHAKKAPVGRPEDSYSSVEKEGYESKVAENTSSTSPSEQKGFNGFFRLGIKKGVALTLRGHPNITCKVVDDKQVSYQNEVMSLTGAARRAYESLGLSGRVSGPANWTLKGASIQDMWQSQKDASSGEGILPKEKQQIDKLNSALRPIYFELRKRLSTLDGADFNSEPRDYVNFMKHAKVVCHILFRKTKLTIRIHRGELLPDGGQPSKFFTVRDPKGICQERTHGKKGRQYVFSVSDADDLDYTIGLIKQKYNHIWL